MVNQSNTAGTNIGCVSYLPMELVFLRVDLPIRMCNHSRLSPGRCGFDRDELTISTTLLSPSIIMAVLQRS